MSDRVVILVAESPADPRREEAERVKNRKRRSRLLVGVALVAASAAVVSAAAFGGCAHAAPPTNLTVVSGNQIGSLASARLADAAGRPPARREAAQVAKVVQGKGGEPAAESVASAGVASLSSPLVPLASLGDAARAWWLEFAPAGSRTRGQPGTDALA